MNISELRNAIEELLKRDVFLEYKLITKIRLAIPAMPIKALHEVLKVLNEAKFKQEEMFKQLLKKDPTLLYGLNKKLNKF